MKLRSIVLCNVRRFAGQRATLAGIGDGITILAEPNEFGKSTFFDALHALFFERHRSRARVAASLQPHSGAAPEVAAELELPEGRFRIEKRWLGRPAARVLDAGGRLIAQEDEAEAWIERLGSGGPSGLLWVRQGILGLEPEGAPASERERLLASRRDLLSSVAGEIDLMTGGRRMDAVLARVTAALAPLATDRLKPRARGDWATAEEEATALATREAGLAARAAALSGALSDRREAERQRRTLEEPGAEAARQAGLAAARTAFEAASAHAARLAEARQDERIAELAAEAAAADLTRLTALRERRAAAAGHLSTAAAERERQAAAAAHARAAEAAALQRAEAAREATRALQARLAAAQRLALAWKAAHARADLADRLARAETFRLRREAAELRLAALPATPETLAAAETAAQALEGLRLRAEARAVTLTFAYEGAARASLDGRPVEAPLRLEGPALLDLPGLGRLTVDPGERAADDLPARLEAARAQFSRALAACGAGTLTEARLRLAEAASAREEAARAAELVQTLVPEGIEALRLALARAEAEAAGAPEAEPEDPAALSPALEAAQRTEAAARAEAVAAQAAAQAAGERLARAEAAEAACRAAEEAAAAELGDPAEAEARAHEARAAVTATAERLAACRSRLAGLAAAAPDLAMAEAGLDRARAVVEQAARERLELAARIAELDGFIRSEASLGIEEELEEVRGRLAAARARARHCEAEARALDRLRRALEEARAAARDAYFGPVTQELRPLLALIHDQAELRLDDRTLLPAALARAGVEEGLEILSGGTREQIAILTRLAFARLFARRGQPVPVILDDALVHADDARIEAMFTALHRIARDQQILVLTCRERAFAALGGVRARVRIEPLG